jgi:predicted nuclease of predicted toxin-antitoxin system
MLANGDTTEDLLGCRRVGMMVLIDENIPLLTLRHLEEIGHDAKDVRGTREQGVADLDLWNIARSEQRP